LSTLAKDALKGQLSEQRLVDIGNQARTLGEAEAAVAGDTGGDIRLIGLLGASDARTMALRVLTLVERAQAISDGGRRLEALTELDLADAELARARARLHRLQRCTAGS
jgi:hypothetical protein